MTSEEQSYSCHWVEKLQKDAETNSKAALILTMFATRFGEDADKYCDWLGTPHRATNGRNPGTDVDLGHYSPVLRALHADAGRR